MPLRRSTIARLLAIALVALAVSPFTPPFVTWDIDAAPAGTFDVVSKHPSDNDPLMLPAGTGPLTGFVKVIFERPVRGVGAPLPNQVQRAVLRV